MNNMNFCPNPGVVKTIRFWCNRLNAIPDHFLYASYARYCHPQSPEFGTTINIKNYLAWLDGDDEKLNHERDTKNACTHIGTKLRQEVVSADQAGVVKDSEGREVGTYVATEGNVFFKVLRKTEAEVRDYDGMGPYSTYINPDTIRCLKVKSKRGRIWLQLDATVLTVPIDHFYQNFTMYEPGTELPFEED